MFHVELREASDRARRLNLTLRELQEEVVEPWCRGEPVPLGERSWRAGQGQLTVLDGPEVAVGSLTMGRCWSVAARQGRDVTGELLAASGRAASVVTARGEDQTLADALGLELLRRLREGPISLHEVWRLARERDPAHAPAPSLQLAGTAVASLSRSALAGVEKIEEGRSRQLTGDELDEALDSVESWAAESGPGALWLRRA